MDFGYLQILFITVLSSTTASEAGDVVFVQTGSSVQLDIQQEKAHTFEKMLWVKDEVENLVRFANDPHVILYKTSVDFNNKTLSLILKNVQKNDSGVYKAKATGVKEICIAEHKVKVLDPVKTPLLNHTMISNSSCVLNVSCFGHDLTLSSTYHSNCSEEEVTSSEIHNLALYCKEDVFVCNYSNPVSWRNDTIKIKQLCTTHEKDHSKEYRTFSSILWLIVIAVTISVLLLLGATVLYCSYRKYRKGTKQTDDTIYAEVEPNNDVQRDLEMSERSEDPHTVYSSENLVPGYQEQISTRECHIYNDVPERNCAKTQRGINHPKTTYCTVGQHNRPSAATEKNISIYSVVSKPQNGKPVIKKYKI
ncbi:natural killer cell receptor 2B4-like isoform X2 [Triplophysa dalaica]|uniref:natural killer cell receptor 2B4-like isoform X2 n=1 Tax=Triplophysa dalaica TaxID=1582913 RepID=UPI0024DFE2B8|nr:natural killer cell receptor 2B4-like isoform X2 [Triplophysa dalaica]